ncbi:MAG: hypothetical protein Q4C13_08560, partial [Clostridia bacterium]|nr:hypothetical protein [Clostridia bacterium]
MPANAERDTAYLDVLRWLATLAVVALHTVSAETAAPFPAIHDGLLFCVPTFAMVTGALFLAPGRTLSYPLLLK